MTSRNTARAAAGIFALGIIASVALTASTAQADATCKCFEAPKIATDCAAMETRSISKEPYGTMTGSRMLTCTSEGKGTFKYISVQQGEAKFMCAYYTPKIANPHEAIDKATYDACLAEIDAAKGELAME